MSKQTEASQTQSADDFKMTGYGKCYLKVCLAKEVRQRLPLR